MAPAKVLPIVAEVLDFAGPVKNSYVDTLNPPELVRVLAAGVAAGGAVGTTLQSIIRFLPDYISPGWFAMGATLVALIAEADRRLNQGERGRFVPMILTFQPRKPTPPKSA